MVVDLKRDGRREPNYALAGGVRSYVVTQIKSPLKQAGFISSRAQAVKKLAET